MLNPLVNPGQFARTRSATVGLTVKSGTTRGWTAGVMALGLVLVGSTGAIAQTAPSPTASGASLLQTQPATLQASGSERSVRAAHLNQVAGTMQAQTAPASSGLLSKVKTPSAPTAVDPLDFFRVPGMNGSVKLPLAK